MTGGDPCLFLFTFTLSYLHLFTLIYSFRYTYIYKNNKFIQEGEVIRVAWRKYICSISLPVFVCFFNQNY